MALHEIPSKQLFLLQWRSDKMMQLPDVFIPRFASSNWTYMPTSLYSLLKRRELHWRIAFLAFISKHTQVPLYRKCWKHWKTKHFYRFARRMSESASCMVATVLHSPVGRTECTGFQAIGHVCPVTRSKFGEWKRPEAASFYQTATVAPAWARFGGTPYLFLKIYFP